MVTLENMSVMEGCLNTLVGNILYSSILALKVEVSLTLIFHFHFFFFGDIVLQTLC